MVGLGDSYTVEARGRSALRLGSLGALPRPHLSNSTRFGHGMFAESFSERNVHLGVWAFSQAVVTNKRQKCLAPDLPWELSQIAEKACAKQSPRITYFLYRGLLRGRLVECLPHSHLCDLARFPTRVRDELINGHLRKRPTSAPLSCCRIRPRSSALAFKKGFVEGSRRTTVSKRHLNRRCGLVPSKP